MSSLYKISRSGTGPGIVLSIRPGISLVLDLASGLKADKPYRSDQTRISDTGVLRNVLSCRLLRKIHAFRAMQASELSICPTGTYKTH